MVEILVLWLQAPQGLNPVFVQQIRGASRRILIHCSHRVTPEPRETDP